MKVYIVIMRGQFGTYVRGVFASIHVAKVVWPLYWVDTAFKENDKYKGRTILEAHDKPSYTDQPPYELNDWYMSEFEVQGIDDEVANLAMLALGGDPMALDLIRDAIGR